MKIRLLEKANEDDIRLFKKFPFDLYKNDKNWVPPLPGAIENVMTPDRHPFYAHSEADFFLLENEKEVIGRIAVIHNRNYCEHHNIKAGFFFLFDCINDQQAADLLFKTAEDWCRDRELEMITGPRGFLRSDGIGLLVGGFTHLPAMGIPYNFPYYPSLVESCGYEKDHDHLSGYLEKHPDPVIHKVAEKVLARGNFKVINFTSTDEIREWISRVDEVERRAFANNPNYYPSTPEEFELLSKNILAIADPRFIKIIKHGDDVAGFIVSYLNINKAIQRSKGKFLPFGWIHLAHEKKNSRILDINGVGLLPEYQGLGGNALLYSEVDKMTRLTKIRKAEIVQVDERNFRSKADMENLGVKFSKTHRTYIKQLK